MATKNSDALAVETRPQAGTTSSNALRRSGKIPAVLFGHGAAPAAIAIDAKAFDELLHAGGKNRLLNLTIDGSGKDTALLRDIQRDPISRRILHADLQRVSATENVTASLPLTTTGVPDGVRNFGGVMDLIMHTIDVQGPANALPDHLEVDVTELGIHQHVTAGEIVLPPNFTLRIDPSTVVISVEASRTEAQAAEAPAAAPAAGDVPTVGETAPAEGSTP
ncbi:MAG: 50S ribosomal protein L25 [Candidatus Eremiobacteraeota bacterium]|nr:50S ribosomal protein L25 [Candidatus Eremiobacteraeota bacterium]